MKTIITLETSNENYDIIEESGILECEGVTQEVIPHETPSISELEDFTQDKASKEMQSLMGVSGIEPTVVLTAAQILLAIAAFKDVTEIIKNIAEIVDKVIDIIGKLRKKNEAFKMTVNRKTLVFDGSKTFKLIENGKEHVLDCRTDEEIKNILSSALNEQ